MKKKLLLSVAAAVAVLSSSISVCAAPQYMADGAVFDPEWYLEQNPDVAAGWSLGTSADALYQHYVRHGASENRAPYDKEHFDPAGVLPYQGESAEPAAETQPESQTETDGTGEIFAVEGEHYQIPSICDEYTGYEDCMINVSFYKVSGEDNYNSIQRSLEQYVLPDILPGYEWREIAIYDNGNLYYETISCSDNIVTNWINIWEEDDDTYATHAGTFTLSLNGTEYPECQLFYADGDCGDDGEGNYYAERTWCALVPKGYNGGLYIRFRGATLENGEPVMAESPSVYFEF